DPQQILVFLHDDVHLDDWFLGVRLTEALGRFDIVGVAGNRRLQAEQDTWYLQPGTLIDGAMVMGARDTDWLSGAVRHGNLRHSDLTVFGPCPSAVRLLDGVFLAARAGTLQKAGVRFDPTLGFHHYDLDFCRVAEAAGLSLGTWPIALTHASRGGSVHSDAWLESRALYLEKWRG
ncbi:MAG: hypothetical protein WCN21_15005, partial [Comamonadaceae bacterium]